MTINILAFGKHMTPFPQFYASNAHLPAVECAFTSMIIPARVLLGGA